MYRVMIYEDVFDQVGKVLHEPNSWGNKIFSGKVKQTLNGIDSFEFEIGMDNSLYQKITAIKNIVEVINETTKESVFVGRVAGLKSSMSNTGLFSETVYCEDFMAYLHDSCQTYEKIQNTTIRDFFTKMIIQHNKQVEKHKQFSVGNVTVKNSTDNVYRYLGYDDTFDTIKDKLISRLGGYLILRRSNGTLFLDYLEDYGQEGKSPLQIASNIQSASREIDISTIFTRLIPLGAEIEFEEEEEGASDAAKPRVNISEVNNNIPYLEDKELVQKFGIIEKSVIWNDVHQSNILLTKAKNYFQEQKSYSVRWSIDAVEISLLDKRYDDFVLGNKYPIILPQVSEIEMLQIVERSIDILNPQKSSLTFGSFKRKLSDMK